MGYCSARSSVCWLFFFPLHTFFSQFKWIPATLVVWNTEAWVWRRRGSRGVSSPHLSLNREDCWGTTDDFTNIFLRSPLPSETWRSRKCGRGKLRFTRARNAAASGVNQAMIQIVWDVWLGTLATVCQVNVTSVWLRNQANRQCCCYLENDGVLSTTGCETDVTQTVCWDDLLRMEF